MRGTAAGMSWLLLLLAATSLKADNNIFGEELAELREEEIRSHTASSVEVSNSHFQSKKIPFMLQDLAQLLCTEQSLLATLSLFRQNITGEGGGRDSKLVQILAKLEQWRVLAEPTEETCLQHAGHPVNSFLLLKY